MKKLFLLPLVIVAFGVTACTKNPPSEPVVDAPPAELTEEIYLTQEVLLSGDWGPVGSLGGYIEFKADGTYVESFAGEGGDLIKGRYQIEGDKVILIPDDNEASWNMSLGQSEDNLYYTRYLSDDGSPKYWDKNKPVAVGSKRLLDSYSLIIVDSNAQLTPEATPKSKPEMNAPVYEFRFCGEGCEVGEVESFAQSFTGVLARTESKEMVAGVEDYWYLVGIELDWYTGALINGVPLEDFKISYAWVHGSELQ